MDKKETMISYRIVRAIVKPLFKLYYSPKIIGVDNIPKEGPIIVAGNHRHTLDQHHILISTKRPIHYMAKKEYFDGKATLFGKDTKFNRAVSKWLVKISGCIPVDRSIKDEEAKEEALEALKQNKAVGLFPEGTRNKTDQPLLPFKFGVVSLAKKTDALIVPVGINGAQKFRSKNLVIRIGKPFKVTDMDLESANSLLREKISELMNG